MKFILKKITLEKVIKFAKENWLLLTVLFFLPLIVFRKYIFEGLLPMPLDALAGLYYPWFDYKWGYETPVPVKNSLPTDIISILYPWRTIGIQMLKNGIPPLWDPYILLGSPLLANFQSAILNPFNILYLFINDADVWGIQVFLQPVLIIMASYLLARDMKMSKPASVFAGILYAFCGYSIVWMEYNSINYTLITLPLFLLGARKVVMQGNNIFYVYTSLLTAFAMLVGYPLNAVYIIVFTLTYYLYLSYNFGSSLKKLCLFLAAIILGFCLAAVQLIPSAELYLNSIRGFDNLALASQVKYLPLTHLISFFIPDYFGNPATWNYQSVGSYDNFAFGISAVGIFFITLFFSVGARVIKKNIFFILLFLVSLLYATENPITKYLYDNDILGFGASVNTRVLFVASFSASVISALGLDLYLKGKMGRSHTLISPLFYMFVFVLLLYLIYLQTNQSLVKILLDLRSGQTFASKEIAVNYVSIRNTMIPLGLSVLTFLVLFIKNKATTLVVVFTLLIANIVYSTDKYLSFSSRSLLYPKTELTEFLSDNLRTSRFSKDERSLVFPSNTWEVYNFRSPSGQNASTHLSSAKYLSLINKSEIKSALYTRYGEIDNKKSPLFKTLNVEYLAAINMDEKDSPSKNGNARTFLLPDNSVKVASIGTTSIFKNVANLGPAWFPEKVICEGNEDVIVRNITGNSYDPGKTVFVDCENENTSPGKNNLDLLYDNGQKLSLNVDVENESYLVISSSYYPGWYYSVDGSKDVSKVTSANIGLMAVKVPAGKHQINVYYSPRSFKAGLAVSISSFFLLLFVCLLIFKFRKNHGGAI